MPNESAPPIRDLPDEIEAAMKTLKQRWTELGRFDRTGDIFVAENAAEHLRQAIRSALDEQDVALRERAERLRRYADSISYECGECDYYMTDEEKSAMAALQPGDLADNLRPRGGDE